MVLFKRHTGLTNADDISAGWEPDYKFNDKVYAYGLAQYERNRFGKYLNRETLGGGIGDRVIATKQFTLDIKAGPAWTSTNYLGTPKTSALAIYGSANAVWTINSMLNFSENASALYATDNTELTSLTALTAKLSKALSASLNYQIISNTNPPPGFKDTDTLTRMTLNYAF